MDTEPPTGDELTQMLVSMKRQVLVAAPPRPVARRRRIGRTGIAIGVVALLGLGAASGAVALGMVPAPFTAAPAPAPTPTPLPTASSEPSSAAVTPSFRPTPSSSPTPTRAAYVADDATTWTISGSEMGPVAVGGQTAAETDDLDAAFSPLPGTGCTPEGVWGGPDGVQVQVVSDDAGTVSSIVVSWPVDADAPGPVPGPTTARGIGVGATLDELQAAYPDLLNDSPGFEGQWSMWSTDTPEGPVRFQIGPGTHVKNIWIGTDANLPTAVCDL